MYSQRHKVIYPVEDQLVVKYTDRHTGHPIGEQEGVSKHDLILGHEVDEEEDQQGYIVAEVNAVEVPPSLRVLH